MLHHIIIIQFSTSSLLNRKTIDFSQKVTHSIRTCKTLVSWLSYIYSSHRGLYIHQSSILQNNSDDDNNNNNLIIVNGNCHPLLIGKWFKRRQYCNVQFYLYIYNVLWTEYIYKRLRFMADGMGFQPYTVNYKTGNANVANCCFNYMAM